MMKELLKKEIILQWRQGFWLVYFVFTAIYVTVLLSLPEKNRMLVSLILILSDTTMLGVIFIGALVLLEKQQAVIQSLFVTPLEPSQYIWSKTISLSLIAISMSILVYLPVWHFSAYTPLLLATIAFTAGTFVLLGLGLAARIHTINQYFGLLMGVTMLLILPVLPYMLLEQHPIFLILPYVASLDLMLGALNPLPVWRILLDIVLLVVWGYIAYRYAIRRVTRYLVFK
jgi:fluoroquinolone transport system permease protein